MNSSRAYLRAHLRAVLFAWTLMILAVAPLHGEDKSAKPSDNQTSNTEKLTLSHQSLDVRGKMLRYTATAGTLPLTDDAGKVEANIFFIAYTKEGTSDLAKRPVMFAFNGGPGASAMWLHMGALGPRRVLLDDTGTSLPASAQLVNNESTWLDFTDLVFIDPVGTGFSRAAAGVDAKKFYEVNGDIDAAARFVRLYVTRFGRWLSPKLIAGESYGTTRAAGLAKQLQNACGINLSGIVFISSAINFETLANDGGHDLPYALSLPSMAATAWYHQKLSAAREADQQKTLAEVERWALGDYLAALAQGDALGAPERDRVAGQLAAFTGLDKAYIDESKLRVDPSHFARQLLRHEHQMTGRMDGRVKGPVLSVVDGDERDPAFFLATGPFVAALNQYLRQDLHYPSDLNYEFISGAVHGAWKWGSGQGYLNMAPQLAEAMTANAHLKILVVAGLYDLVTPYFSQRYTFEHLGLAPSLLGNITYATYPAGHQVYTSLAVLKRLHADAAAFVQKALAN